MQPDQILILVATEDSVALCANCNGASHLIRKFATIENEGDSPADFVRTQASRRTLARNIAAVLSASTAAAPYESIVIIASAEMMTDLRRAMNCARSTLAITEILKKTSNRKTYADMGPRFTLPRAEDVRIAS